MGGAFAIEPIMEASSDPGNTIPQLYCDLRAWADERECKSLHRVLNG